MHSLSAQNLLAHLSKGVNEVSKKLKAELILLSRNKDFWYFILEKIWSYFVIFLSALLDKLICHNLSLQDPSKNLITAFDYLKSFDGKFSLM